MSVVVGAGVDPGLIGGLVTGPELELGADSVRAAVNAFSGLRVVNRAGVGVRPLLFAASAAGVEGDQVAVGGTAVAVVQAFACDGDGAVGLEGPLLGGVAVASRKLPGSWGLIYERDDEMLDPPGPNAFRVRVLARGTIVERPDSFLSPCNPIIED